MTHEKANKKGLSKYTYLISGAIALLFLGMIYAWSIFKSPLKELIPVITDQQLSLTFTISIIFFCVGGLISGFSARIISSRYRILISSVLVFVGLVLMSTLSAETLSPALKMYLFYGVLCGTGVGFGYNGILSGVMEHFPDKVGLASGVLMLGFGFGGIVLGSLASAIEKVYGIGTTFFILSFLFLPPLIICAYIMGVKQDKADFDKAKLTQKQVAHKDYNSKQMLKTGFFAWFIIWNILICSCGLMIIGSASQIAQSFGASAIIGLMVSVANGGGRIFIGKVYDSKGESFAVFSTVAFLLLSGILLLAGYYTGLTILGILGLLSCGISYGCSPALASCVIKDTYGPKYYPSNFSIINLQLIVAATVGPTLSHCLREQSGGSFQLSYLSILIFAGASLFVAVIMKKSKQSLS
ncbi:MAG: MFS transporter [Bacillota bacterium]|nr:MFS transporter [Bacillota bacterium]